MSLPKCFSVARMAFLVSGWNPSSRLQCLTTHDTSCRFSPLTPSRNYAKTRPSLRCCGSIAQNSSGLSDHVLRVAASRGGLQDTQIERLLHLSELLMEVNNLYNLTAIRTRDAVLLKHLVDGLSLLPHLDDEDPKRIIDVGTGAGFPGLVLAIARPKWQITLLDSVRKKTQFHALVEKELQLRNVQSIWARAEEVGQDRAHREHYDAAVARSVAEMRVLAELCLPLVAVKGCFVAQKSVDASHQEIKLAHAAITTLGGSLESVSPAWQGQLNGQTMTDRSDESQKSIVVVRKTARTPRRYPRHAGMPKKAPLS